MRKLFVCALCIAAMTLVACDLFNSPIFEDSDAKSSSASRGSSSSQQTTTVTTVACYSYSGSLATCTETTSDNAFANKLKSECYSRSEYNSYSQVRSSCPSLSYSYSCSHKGVTLHLMNTPNPSQVCSNWSSGF